jgi:hypothetical protein
MRQSLSHAGNFFGGMNAGVTPECDMHRRSLVRPFFTSNLEITEMKNGAVEVKRYSLEQDYVVDERRNIETFWTAVISIIGYEPLIDFKRALAALNYGEGRFSSPSQSIAGRWVEQTEQSERRVPGMLLGLIFANIDSEAATARTWAEIKRYSVTGNIPMIACCTGKSEQMKFAERIKELSIQHDVSYHFVQLIDVDNRNTNRFNAVTKGTIYFVEAMLATATYPGLICVDLADVLSAIEGRKNLRAFRITATSFEELISSIKAAIKITSNKLNVIATLFAPFSLELNQVADCFSAVKDQMPDNAIIVSAALVDSGREEFTLYVVICE